MFFSFLFFKAKCNGSKEIHGKGDVELTWDEAAEGTGCTSKLCEKCCKVEGLKNKHGYTCEFHNVLPGDDICEDVNCKS